MEKSKLFVLIGHSGSGKDTILRQLRELGMEGVVSLTTRPPRKNEVDGIDYHYVTDEKFNYMKSKGLFAEYVKYPKDDEAEKHGFQWQYGCLGSDLVGEKVIIVEKEGLEQLRKNADKFGLNLFVIFVKTPKEIRRERLYARGDNPKEIARRLESDEIQFSDIAYNMVIHNSFDSLTELEEVTRTVIFPALKDDLFLFVNNHAIGGRFK